MLYIGNNEIKKVYLGETNISSGYVGTVPFWGSEEPVVTMTPDFVVHYYVKPEGETLYVVNGDYTDIIDKVGRYNLTTGQYEVIEFPAEGIVIDENEPFQYGFTLKNKTVMDMMPFSDNMDVREIDLHTLTTLRKLTGSIAYPFERDPNDFFIDLPNTVQRFEDTPCVCATVRIWDNGAYRYGLPSGVTYIGMPEGHEEDEGLGGGAFDSAKLWSGDYSDIYEFIIPASVTHLEKGAFANAQLPPRVTVNSTVGVPDYLFDSASFGNGETANLIDIKIAEGNTSVGDNAFMVYGDTSRSIPWVYSLSLPSTLRTIGDGAFAGMMFSVGLDLPDGLTTIGEYAFSRIYKEQAFGDLEITIPASVTTFGAGAFESAEIKALHFNSTTPAAIDGGEYDVYPFDNCHTREQDPETFEFKPTPLYVPCEAVDTYKTAWSMYADRISCPPEPYTKKAILTLDDETVVEIPAAGDDDTTLRRSETQPYTSRTVSAVICEGVKALDDNVFSYSPIQEVSLPNTLLTIGGAVFERASQLTGDLIIPDNVTSVGDYAFSRTSLSTIVFGKNVESISRYALAYTSSLNAIIVTREAPASLGEYVFHNTYCPIYVPCDYIDLYKAYWSDYADRIECHILNPKATLTLSDGSTVEIPQTSMTDHVIEKSEIDSYSATCTEAVIHSDTTEIADGVFSGCPNLTFVRVENYTPPTLGENVFSDSNELLILVDCYVLEDYKTAEGWSNYADKIQCIPEPEYPNKAFITLGNGETVEIKQYEESDTTLRREEVEYYSSDAVEVYISDAVTSVESLAFNYFSRLRSVIIDNGVTTIGEKAFDECRSLSSITLPETLASIGGTCFEHCAFSSITIPDSVTSIGRSLFAWNDSLTNVTMGSGITSIGENMFARCPNLSELTIKSTTPPTLDPSALHESDPAFSGTIYVPCESIESYKAANVWSDYADQIQCIPAPPPPDPFDDYFHFIALTSGSQVKAPSSLEYSINEGSWTVGDNEMKTLNAGDVIYFRSDAQTRVGSNIFKLSSGTTQSLEVAGNIMSLVYGADFRDKTVIPCEKCFSNLFYTSDTAPVRSLRKAGNLILPATTLTNNCYAGMFAKCSSLTTVPALPATTLKKECYKDMFNGCSSLTTAPTLPALTLVDGCYTFMFFFCSKLNYVKAMFTTTPKRTYTNGWLNGVASSGTFVKNKNATWYVRDTYGVPQGWTIRTANP